MEVSNKNIEKITTSLSHILLPTCNEAEEDVFHNVLKSIFSRSKYENSFLDNAFELGMSGGVFSIEEEDLSMNWKQLNSEEQQIRQSKLLGFWARENFPSLGKQLCGPLWQAKVKSLQIINHSKEISADEINAMIFKKIKLRVLQLNVSNSTLGKLKYFVNVPDTIAKRNESKVSKTIKAFDIDDQWIEHCWKALKLGGFSLAFEQQRDLIETLNQLESMPNLENGEQMNGGNESSSVTPKRTYLDTLDYNVNVNTLNVNGDSSIGSPSIQAPKRPYMDIVDANVNDGYTADINGDSSTGSQPVLTPRTNCNAECTNSDSSIDFQAAILNLRNDIGRLTDMFQSTTQERDSEIATGQERFHIIVINQKDGEISQLKATVQELRQVNDGLMKDQLKSVEQIEKQAALMNVLQKGAEANLKLHEQSDRYLMENLNLIETMKRQIADAAITKQNMEDELSATNQTKDILRDVVNTLKEKTANLVIELKAQIETLDANLTAAEQMNSDTIDQKVKLQEELDAWKRYTVSKEEELENVHKSFSELRKQIDSLENCNRRENSDMGKQTATCNEMEKILTEYEMSGIEPNDIEPSDSVQTDSGQCGAGDAQGGSDYEELFPRPMEETSAEDKMIGFGIKRSDMELNDNVRHDSVSSDTFVTDDPIVQECRDRLKEIPFAWIKYYSHKNAKYHPGFIYPVDPDGYRRAQKVTGNGYVCNTKNRFFEFAENVSDDLKDKSGVSALKKFNKKFNFSYV